MMVTVLEAVAAIERAKVVDCLERGLSVTCLERGIIASLPGATSRNCQ